MKLTWIDLNSWLFQLGGQTLLVDPWLVDPLVFYGQPWLFTARHKTPLAFTPSTLPPIDGILISQGVDDHCHIPTLELLDRTLPVIASPSAAKQVEKLGFERVITLGHWQTCELDDRLEITAIPGAELQPGQVENGYRLKDLSTGQTLYYEPHEFPTSQAAKLGQIDVAISPVIGQVLPLLGQVVMGTPEAIQLVQTLKPKAFLPTTRGEIIATGLLPAVTRSVGSVEEFRDRLTATGLPTQLRVPNPGEMVEIPL
jgi:L-ascorbate metabolism protein UlaG (beta-lactamase superfamily)